MSGSGVGASLGAGEERRDPGWEVLHRTISLGARTDGARRINALRRPRTPGSRCSRPRRRRRRSSGRCALSGSASSSRRGRSGLAMNVRPKAAASISPALQQPLGLVGVVVAGPDDRRPGTPRAASSRYVVGQRRAAGPVGLGEVQEGEAARRQLARRRAARLTAPSGSSSAVEGRRSARSGCRPGRATRRPATASTTSSSSRARFSSVAAVVVGAVVAVGGEELVQQVAVGAVDLDEVEAGVAGVDGRAAVVLDAAAGSRRVASARGVGQSARVGAPSSPRTAGAVAVGLRARRHRAGRRRGRTRARPGRRATAGRRSGRPPRGRRR